MTVISIITSKFPSTMGFVREYGRGVAEVSRKHRKELHTTAPQYSSRCYKINCEISIPQMNMCNYSMYELFTRESSSSVSF